MKRNMFGDAQPANLAELVDALDERGVGADEVYADLYPPQEENIGTEWDGWTAEIRANDPEELGEWDISTLGFKTRSDIEDVLLGAGIDHASINLME